jgi:hypothetical protein
MGNSGLSIVEGQLRGSHGPAAPTASSVAELAVPFKVAQEAASPTP